MLFLVGYKDVICRMHRNSSQLALLNHVLSEVTNQEVE